MANSASAMPGATTARPVFLASAMAVKLRMMPQTVPNRPTNGATEPTVARMLSRSVEAIELGGDGRVHPRREPLAGAGAIDRAVGSSGATRPCRRTSTAAVGSRSLPRAAVEGVDIVGRPEIRLETVVSRG